MHFWKLLKTSTATFVNGSSTWLSLRQAWTIEKIEKSLWCQHSSWKSFSSSRKPQGPKKTLFFLFFPVVTHSFPTFFFQFLWIFRTSARNFCFWSPSWDFLHIGLELFIIVYRETSGSSSRTDWIWPPDPRSLSPFDVAKSPDSPRVPDDCSRWPAWSVSRCFHQTGVDCSSCVLQQLIFPEPNPRIFSTKLRRCKFSPKIGMVKLVNLQYSPNCGGSTHKNSEHERHLVEMKRFIRIDSLLWIYIYENKFSLFPLILFYCNCFYSF